MSSSHLPELGWMLASEDLDDLFEEAPVAYVHEHFDTRFIRANRAARELLGISSEEVGNTFGMSLVVDDPVARPNVLVATLDQLRSHGQTEHRVVELLRKGQRKASLGAMVVEAVVRRWVHSIDVYRHHSSAFCSSKSARGFRRRMCICKRRSSSPITSRRSLGQPRGLPKSWPRSRVSRPPMPRC